ncbi:hypothetical protein CkaCkLH20_05106 [Colletotrichum karsti]|uniref:Uncharacterized protein n=1 Tax=Colletotrichum karsti TaxID=1095194 RepID=A0A9P6I920_9PEZI|nr:uncharacterized protein CkaCkLH20_05106 [Colletotrichum karsti]KAF9877406.1 hypothetical protein CkaCkLH20_05106 [Colletotrichum karsti]
MRLPGLTFAVFIALACAIVITPTNDANALINAAVIDSRLVTATNNGQIISYYQPPGIDAGGTFTDGGSLLGLSSGVILTTGKASQATSGNTPSFQWAAKTGTETHCPGGTAYEFTYFLFLLSIPQGLTGVRVNYRFATQEPSNVVATGNSQSALLVPTDPLLGLSYQRHILSDPDEHILCNLDEHFLWDFNEHILHNLNKHILLSLNKHVLFNFNEHIIFNLNKHILFNLNKDFNQHIIILKRYGLFVFKQWLCIFQQHTIFIVVNFGHCVLTIFSIVIFGQNFLLVQFSNANFLVVRSVFLGWYDFTIYELLEPSLGAFSTFFRTAKCDSNGRHHYSRYTFYAGFRTVQRHKLLSQYSAQLSDSIFSRDTILCRKYGLDLFISSNIDGCSHSNHLLLHISRGLNFH